MKRRGNPTRLLAIDPTPRGFGFIVLEGMHTVVDWGVRSGRATSIAREQQLLRKVSDLLRQYRPHIVVLENTAASGSRRRGRVRLVIEATANLAMWEGITVKRIAISTVRKVFMSVGARTKHEIARVIAMQLPQIAAWLPKPRSLWTGEDYRMAVFDAAALALAHFYGRNRRRES